MNTKTSFGWKVLLAILLLFAISSWYEARAENLEEILKNKIPVAQGRCYFKGENFLAFAAGTWMSPRGFMNRVEMCFVFAESMTPMNPVWLVLLGREGFPKEVIKWDDSFTGTSDEFTSVWKPGDESVNPPEPAKRREPKQTETKI